MRICGHFVGMKELVREVNCGRQGRCVVLFLRLLSLCVQREGLVVVKSLCVVVCFRRSEGCCGDCEAERVTVRPLIAL